MGDRIARLDSLSARCLLSSPHHTSFAVLTSHIWLSDEWADPKGPF